MTSFARKTAVSALLSGVLCAAVSAQTATVFSGSTKVNQTSATTVVVSVKLPAGGTPTSAVGITQSATTSEFTVTDPGSCTGATYGAGQMCSVTVSFTPKFPGLRKGAVVVSNGTTVLGSALVSGIGSGPLSVIQPGVINTVVGSTDWVYVQDGVPANGAPIFLPTGITEDAAGNLFLSDSNNQRIRRVDAKTGLISTVAGDGSPGYNGDGGAATAASINQPAGLVVDGAGDIYFVDHGNHCVRRVDAFSGFISTVAGVCGSPGYTGDGHAATAAGLRLPEGLAIDALGNLYIGDTGNNAVREVTAVDGNITTIAGTGIAGYNGEGAATSKQLSSPWGVAMGPGGTLYIADRNNERVRAVNGGVISTVAGIGSVGLSGDGSAATSATMDSPVAVTVDPAGNLYIADSGNNRVREVTSADGNINTVVGTSSEEFAGDTGPANMASIYGPYALYFDQSGNLLLADMFHNRVREVSGTTVALTYPTMRVGKFSAPQMETLFNDGNATLNVSSLALVNAALDPVTTTCSTTQVLLTTNPSCALGVEFNPQSTGTLVQGSLTVNSDAANSPDVISLSGQVLSVNVTTIALVSSVNPSMLNSPVTFTATMGSPDTTLGGTVTFYDGTVAICNVVAVSNKAATCMTSALILGSHNITANYTGDSDNSAVTSSPALVQVVKQQPTVALTVSPNPAIVLQSVTMTAKVTASNATPTGSVTFLDGANAIGTAGIDTTTNIATISTTTLAPGTHSITAKYSGDTATAALQSTPPVSEVINQATTATTIGTSATPVQVGTSITLSSTVSSLNNTTPTGTVAFMEGTVSLGSGTIANGAASLTISTLAPGSHTIFARYSGDTDDATSDSSSFVEVVNQIGTTTTVTATANPASAGDAVQVTATVVMAAGFTADGAITGTVTFTDGATTVGTQRVSANGTASIVISAITAGSHTLVATYAGNTNYMTSTSNSLTEVVNSTSTATGLGVSGSGLAGKPLTLTASVSSQTGIPTGTVSFQDGGVNIGSGTLNAQGVATLTISTLSVGNHSLVAVYQGSSDYNGSSSAAQPEAIALATTQLVLAGPASPMNAGVAASFTATLTTNGVTPTAAVALKDNGTVIATQPASGTVTFSGLVLAIGPHTLTAVYAGDMNNAGSTSNSVSLTIQQASTVTTLQTSVNPQVLGQSVTFTAGVTSAGPNLAGSVNFLDGTTVLGSGSLANGTATFTTSSLTFGSHTITAMYVGDTNHATSTSTSIVEHIVDPAQVGVTSSLNPSVSGANVMFTVKVVGNGTIVPTGTVNFLDNGSPISSATLDASGSATYSTTTLAVGAHPITVSYVGDSNYFHSTSSTLTQSVTNADTQVALSASANPATYGAPLTLQSVVTSNGGLATGLVTFVDGNTVIGTGTLDATGTASLTISSLSVGSHSIVAKYAGDGKASASVSPSVTVVVKQTTTVAVASSANPAQTLASIVLTAHVTNAGQSVPTGTVTFTDGATQLGVGTLDTNGNATLTVPQLSAGSHAIVGSYAGDTLDFTSVSPAMTQTVNLRSTSTTLSSTIDPTNAQQITLIAAIHYTGPTAPTGTVTFASAGKTLGSAPVDINGVSTLVIVLSNGQTEAVTATYSGDTAYTGSASPATTVGTGTPTNFTMTLSPASATILSKQHTVTTLSIVSLNSFSDSLEYGCLGLPYAATCTFSSTQQTLVAGGTTSVQLTVDTGDPLGAGAKAENKMPASNVLVCFVPGMLLFGLGMVRSRKRSKITMLALFLVFGAAVASMTGCGGLTVNGTPAGTYQFQVTARATATGVTESQTMTLIVK